MVDENDEPDGVKWMARLPDPASERNEPEGKYLKLLSECFKKKLVIVKHKEFEV